MVSGDLSSINESLAWSFTTLCCNRQRQRKDWKRITKGRGFCQTTRSSRAGGLQFLCGKTSIKRSKQRYIDILLSDAAIFLTGKCLPCRYVGGRQILPTKISDAGRWKTLGMPVVIGGDNQSSRLEYIWLIWPILGPSDLPGPPSAPGPPPSIPASLKMTICPPRFSDLPLALSSSGWWWKK